MAHSFCGETQRKKPLQRPWLRWKNIKIECKGKLWVGMDSSGSGDGQAVNSCKHSNEPSYSIKCG